MKIHMNDPIMGSKPMWYAARNGRAYAYSIELMYANERIPAPHTEFQDTRKNREKVVRFLNENLGKKVSIKVLAEQLNLTEQFVIAALEDYEMEISEESE